MKNKINYIRSYINNKNRLISLAIAIILIIILVYFVGMETFIDNIIIFIPSIIVYLITLYLLTIKDIKRDEKNIR